MNHKLLHTLIGLIAALALTGCDVHEMPDTPAPAGSKDLVLHLNFDTEMPPYKEIIYETGARAPFPDGSLDLRYTIHLYRSGNTRSLENRIPDSVITMTKNGALNVNQNVPLSIPHGDYAIMVWTDFVESGSTADRHYNTDFFYSITLQGEHSGNDDSRDAFRGMASEHIDDSHSGHISMTMMRPMAKYKFISTDLEEFLSREEASARAEAEARGEEGSKGPDDDSKGDDDTRYPDVDINLDDYRILFRYTGFMPHVFNMFTDKPSDARTGVTFPGRITKISDTEAELGFDYVFVNGHEALVTVAVEVYNKKNELIGASRPINVPLKRSTLTRVRGEFLTSRSSGGVGISPGFNGDINIVIP